MTVPLSNRRRFAAAVFVFLALIAPHAAHAWSLNGVKHVSVQTRDGQDIVIGEINFQPQGDYTHFILHLDHKVFKDYFLSMKEFKCLVDRI